MALFRIRPTKLDIRTANAIARHTNPPVERCAEVLTWGADEHLLCAAAAAWWLACRHQNRRQRRISDHVLICTVTAAVLPHLMKGLFDQERPDRRTVRGHWRGVPVSGNRYDAFPSGHAIHVGALASAATLLPPKARYGIWAVGGVLVLTRVVLLAHWVSDVTAGLAIGAIAERLIRPFSRPMR